MEKDSIANVVSYTGLAAAFMNWESLMTIVLLVTGITLNIIRIREKLIKK